MKKPKAWALVTGGSSGIGLGFSRKLAGMGYGVVMASLDRGELNTAAEKLQVEFDIPVETLCIDLSKPPDVAKVIDRLESSDKPVEVLVNDAGFAVHDSLLAEDTTRQRAAFAVMAEAILELSGAAARAMKRRGQGKIINISSTSAWLFAGNYSAIKRWILSYTESLALELRGTGVSATAVCPGWVKTNFHSRAGVTRPHIPNWLWVSVDSVVKSALSAAGKGKSRVVPTLRWKIAVFLLKHCECVARAVSRRLVTRRISEIDRRHRQ